ncbi:hypothetical protein [Roseivirga echinicomitans]|uniref:Outer membrane protein beta-barrel domain-containing protein n=1 Tax=Roseivirga echinicomitans TaxID=296218 RepID=A0A150XK36_9BACT|nr:hypothetical protein [Roseivirga echinicomitans]KYG79025.1 hypothetical protein AWN68_05170 [Roseivirga echinicomitans]
MKIRLALLFGMCCCFSAAKAQSMESYGVDIQAYPAGMMFMAKTAFNLNEHNVLNTRIGYNMARRQDFGEHDNEEGGGLGLNIGFKHYLKPASSGLYYELKSSIWFMNIDWRDNKPIRTGSTSITVFQPTAIAGYDFNLSSKVSFGLYAEFGYEINVISSGEDVGQGGISLVGFSLSRKL